MKRLWCLLLIGLLMTVSLLSVGCDRKPETASSTPDGLLDDFGDVDGAQLSLTKVAVYSEAKVEQVFGVFKNLICVFGERNGQRGFFYVTTAGELLGDTVFYYATSDFIYENGGGYYAYVRTLDYVWHKLYTNGELSAPIDDPTEVPLYERYMEEADGKELWSIRDRDGFIVLEPTYSWIEAIDNAQYIYAVTADGQPVLIDRDGKVRVTLPERCTGVTVGPAGFVAKFQYGEYEPVYSLLDFNGRQLTAESCEDLTTVQKGLAAGVQGGKLVVLDMAGSVCLRTDFVTMQERGAVAFDGDTVAAVLADNTLGIVRVTYKEEPLFRVALELVSKAEWIERLYNESGNAGGRGEEGEDYLKKGTKLEYMGQQIVLENDYEVYMGYFPEFQVTDWEDLETIVESVYTRDTAVESFYTTNSAYAHHFIQHNGKVFGILAEGVYGCQWDEGSLTILSQTADTVCFSVRQYLNYPTDETVDTHYFCMKKTDAGWRLESAYLGDTSMEEMRRKMAYRAFLRAYVSEHGVDSAAYGFENIDGIAGDELLLNTADCQLSVYTYVNGQVKEVDTWTYYTATVQFLYCRIWKSPGLVVFSHGGGLERLQYMAVVDGQLTFEEVLTQTPDGENVTEITEDETLLSLARAAYKEGNILNFRALPGKY